MKNKIIFILFLSFIFCANLFAAENYFSFESKSIEYKDDKDIIIAKDNVKITTLDGITATADESRFYKSLNKLFLFGKVKIYDKERNITLESNEIEFDKNQELIVSKNYTKIYFENGYIVNTYDLNYLRNEEILKSNEKTTLVDGLNNKVKVSDFNYNNNNKIFKSRKIHILDKDSNSYFADNAFIDLNNDRLAAQDVKVYFTQDGSLGGHARLKGNSIVSEGSKTTINKAIFTTCKPSDKCPPWSLVSDEVVHDKEKKTINYKKAWLKLYDKPVFYFPKFFHPDPTVERQSGFLIPSMVNSSNNGNSLKIPYYHVISESADFTIQPRVYFNNDFLLENEYRQVGENFKHISDFSLKKLSNVTKSHIFSNTIIDTSSENFDFSNIEINYENTSNDTYLKSNKLKKSSQDNYNLLNSYLKFETSNSDLDLLIETSVFKDLTKDKDSDKYHYILPNFKISKLISTSLNFDGDLIFSSYGALQKRDTNITENYIINDLDYSSENFTFKNGLVSNFDINYKNSSKDGENSNSYRNNFKSENFISTNYNIKYPLIKKNKFLNTTLTPKINLKYSPFKSKNISELDRNIFASNIFSNNRLGLMDKLEGGQSLTLGFDYEIIKDNDTKIFTSSLGQIFRDVNDSNLPKKSKMQTKRSDIVGEINFLPNDNLKFKYNFSADNDLDSVDYNRITSDIIINNFVTTFDFLEENDEIGRNSYFEKKIKYDFDGSKSIMYNTRRNRKTDLTEFYNLIYEYKNDCLVASIEYNKDYYEDRGLQPNEEIFFSLTITPFASVSSPSIK